MGILADAMPPHAAYARVLEGRRDVHFSRTILRSGRRREFVISPKNGPALHTHVREDEVWWVLEGDFRFKAGDAMFWVSEGGMAFGPRGVPHNFQNVGESPGRLLVVTAPSGAERLFEEYSKLLPGPVDPEALSALGHASWIDFIGPPLEISDPLG